MTFMPALRRFRSAASMGLTLALGAASVGVQTGTLADDAQYVTIKGHLPPVMSSSHIVAREDPQENVNLALALPVFNQPQLSDLLQHIYTPGDPLYGQYIT